MSAFSTCVEIDKCVIDLDQYRRPFFGSPKNRNKAKNANFIVLYRSFYNSDRSRVGVRVSRVYDWRLVRRRAKEIHDIAAQLDVQRWKILTDAFVNAFGETAFAEAQKRRHHSDGKNSVLLLSQDKYDSDLASVEVFDGVGLRHDSFARVIKRASEDSTIKYHTLSKEATLEYKRQGAKSWRLFGYARTFQACWQGSLELFLRSFVKDELKSSNKYASCDHHDAERLYLMRRSFLLNDGVENFVITFNESNRQMTEYSVVDGR